MSVASILSSNLVNYSSQYVQSRMKQMQQEFQQLGQDLQSGNLSAAQTDFTTLQQFVPTNPTGPSASAVNNSPVAQAFSQLSKDLQSGNLSAAQQDYSTLQQDFQGTTGSQTHGHHHHGGHGGASNQISQLFSQLGQALQSGNLSSAQQAYSSLQQEFQQFAQSNAGASTTAAGTNTLSVSA